MTNAYTSQATVPTSSAARYAKQLAAHIGHKAEIRPEPEGPRVVFDDGSCLLVALADTLELRAESETYEGLQRVQHVAGSHLERFGQRTGLSVQWVIPA
jgi:hypothetical protein